MTDSPADIIAVQHYVRSKTGLPWDALGIKHATPQGGGYHEGHDLLHAAGRAPEDPGSDYSYVESQRDRQGLTNSASAFDMGDGFARFREITLALVVACQRGDPRTRDIREIIYTPDGVTVHRWDKLGRRTGGDSSHLSHTHTSFFRDSEGRRASADNFLGLLRELFEGPAPLPLPSATTEDDVGYYDVPEGVAFNDDAGSSWLDMTKSIALAVPKVGPADWGPRWVWLAGTKEAIVRLVYNGGGWGGVDVHLTPADGGHVIGLPLGTTEVFIGYKATSGVPSPGGATFMIKGDR
jgi:hypothetical protein